MKISTRFDLKGFLLVSATLTAMQLMLDRGQLLDWFTSVEVSVEAALMVLFGYLSMVHLFTTRDPFINPAIFKDRNFTLGTMISALVGVFMVGVMPLVTTMMQQLLGYPVTLAGLVSLPRAIGNIMTVVVVGWLAGKVDARVPIVISMTLYTASFWILAGLNLDVSPATMAWISLMQGLGSGMLFLPLMLLIFTTLPERFKNQGATMFSLMRNVGGAVGVSVVQTITLREMAATRSQLAESVRPDNPIVGMRLPDFDLSSPLSVAGELGELTRQAAATAYSHTFSLLLIGASLMIPLCLSMKTGKSGVDPALAKGMIIE